MGIIAGIAVPTTIAVINRQRRNSAVKSAENMYAAAKTVLMEAAGASDASIVSGSYADGTETAYYVTIDKLVSSGELEKNPIESTNKATVAFAIGANNKFSIGQVDGSAFSAASTTMTLNGKAVVGTNETDGSVSFAIGS